MELPRMFLSDTERTFAQDESLPSAPVPPLNHTIAKYLDSVRPHLTEAEFRHTEDVARRFASGVGRDLHHKLLEKHKHARNWLEQWWQDKGYLELRFPAAPLINITGPGPYYHTYWPPKDGTQVERAAYIAWSLVQYWDTLRKERLIADRGGKTTIWDMTQYRRLFNTCKIPGEVKDQLLNYFKTEREGPCPNHYIVLCKGRFFKMDTMHNDGELLTAPEIQAQLQHIRDTCDRAPAVPGIGVLTSEQRTTWAKLHEHLRSLHPAHAQHLETIQSALAVISLDDSPPPKSFDELAYRGLCGNGEQRWFDKSVNMAVYQNGTVCSNLDHSPYEGIVYILATYFCYLIFEKTNGKWIGPTAVRNMPRPEELVFHLDQHILQAVDTAKTNYQKQIDNIEVGVPIYRGYGKDLMKKFRLHPDAYIQVALQLAYYRLYRKRLEFSTCRFRPAPTYETASVRKFYHGRTETLRSCTSEALAWSKAMLDPAVSARRRLQLLQAAVNKHNQLMAEAMELKGCDRHLFGLSLMAQEEGLEVPEIFTDKAFTKSGGGGNYVLSTSFVGYSPVVGGCAAMCAQGYGVFYSIQPDTGGGGNFALSTSFIGYYHAEAIMHGGCAPMCPGGYLVAYAVNPDKLTFFISTWVNDADTHSSRMFASLRQTLDEMRGLLESSAHTASKV